MPSHAAHVESPPGHHRPVRRPSSPAEVAAGTASPGPGSTSSWPATGPRARPPWSPDPDAPRPRRVPRPADLVDLIVRAPQGADRYRPGRRPGDHRLAPGPPSRHRVARSTISRHLTAAGLVTPEPKKRPEVVLHPVPPPMPNETWQSDFTHYRLTDPTVGPAPTGDHQLARRLLPLRPHVSAHPRVTTPIVLTTFRQTLAQHGIPASTLTDNGMVYTTRLSGGSGGRNSFETELRRREIRQKNSTPSTRPPAARPSGSSRR